VVVWCGDVTHLGVSNRRVTLAHMLGPSDSV
jgi:hypothetical protein